MDPANIAREDDSTGREHGEQSPVRASIATDVLAAFARLGDRTAVVAQRGLRSTRWTGARIAATASQVARELEARGLSKGDRVIVWAENSPEWIALFYGCMLRGCIVVPLDRDSAHGFVERIVEQTRPKLLVTETAESIDAPELEAIAIGDLISGCAGRKADSYPARDIEPNDTAEIIFTSGTTGTPKGVILTHANIMANVRPLVAEFNKYRVWIRIVRRLRILSLPPLSHVFGQFTGLFMPPYAQCGIVFVDTANPSEIVNAARRHRVAAIAAVPRVLQTLRSKIERDVDAQGGAEAFQKDLTRSDGWSPWRRLWHFRALHRRFGFRCVAFVTGGATLDAETEQFWSRLGFAVIQGYGMTETAALVSMNVPFRIGRGSIGEVLPGQEVRVDETGEILVRGANVTPGYWGRSGDSGLEGGWLHTGDIGAVDAEGHLFFTGRKKDVIVTSAGLKIYPEDIEAALMRQHGVHACAVVGAEGPLGPEPVAALILDPGVDGASVVAGANASLAEFQRIRRWVLWPESDFPRTSTQKIRKPRVAEFVRVGPSGEPPSAGLAQIVARVGGDAGHLTPTARLADDLKLDSLGLVELLSAIEDRYQVDLDESAFTAATTVGDVERMIQTGRATAQPFPYPRWSLSTVVRLLRVAFQSIVVVPLAWWLSLLNVRGRENLDGIDGPVLFVSNHVTAMDPGILLPALPFRFRKRLAIAMIGEVLQTWRYPPSEYWWPARLGRRVLYVLVVALMNVFPLPQMSGFRRSFAHAGEAIDRGYNLLVFPEGSRTTDGRIHAFQSGIGLLATGLGVPVVPLRIDGLYDIKLRRRIPLPGSVSISIGPPMRFDRDDDALRVAADIERGVSEL